MMARRNLDRRQGATFLELLVSFTVLCIALTGLVPLVIMQSHQMARLESHFNSATTYYLVPSSDTWAQKLGAAAVLQSTDPGAKPTAPSLVIVNGAAGYSETGTGWQDNSAGLQGYSRIHAAANGTDSAEWTFTGLQSGWYQVLATWPAASNQANNATYQIYDGTPTPILRGSVAVDQTAPPSGVTSQGQPWTSLGTFPIRSNSLNVILNDVSSGQVCADTIWIVPVRNTVQVNSFTRSLTDPTVTASVTLTVVTP
jgi:hypothetical protein